MGIPAGAAADAAKQILQKAQTAKESTRDVLETLKRVAAAPADYVTDDRWGALARLVLDRSVAGAAFVPRAASAPYRIWGEHLESTAVDQLKNACRLPVSAAGALMPDAHVGYGLPIGGVLATDECRHSLRRRRRYRLPHEDDGARFAGSRPIN